jgi:hypothetical protein
MDRLHVIHSYSCQHVKLANDRMTRYDRLDNSVGYQEGDQLWLYRLTRSKGKSPKIQPS